jgi:hypothetical protein
LKNGSVLESLAAPWVLLEDWEKPFALALILYRPVVLPRLLVGRA